MLSLQRVPDFDAPNDTLVPFPDPGTISITSPQGTFELTGALPFPSFMGPEGTLAWAPGDTVTVASTGGDVPAFSRTLVIPPVLAFTLPADGSELDRSKDLVVSWTGPASPEYVNVELGQSYWDPKSKSSVFDLIICHVPSEAERVTIPHGLIGGLASTDHGAGLGASRETFESISAGAYRVDFWASGSSSQMTFASVR